MHPGGTLKLTSGTGEGVYRWMKHCGTREFCPPAPAQTHMWMNLYSDPLVDLNRSFVNVEFEVEPGFALRGWYVRSPFLCGFERGCTGVGGSFGRVRWFCWFR